MKKKLLTYSNPKTHKKYNLLIKNNLKVKMKPNYLKYYYTGEDLSNLGFISSMGGSRTNSDYFNIYSKSALFDYDTAKKINEFCQSKKDLGETTYYNLKKRRILSEYRNFDSTESFDDNPFAGSYTYIKRIVVSKLGEGIAYASTFDIFPGDKKMDGVDWWINPGVIEGEVKYSKLPDSIDVEDNSLCFGYFDVNFDIGLYENLDFFKNKSKENIKKFKTFINEKYNSVLNKVPMMGGVNAIECKVRNGRHKFYLMTMKRDIKYGALLKKGDVIGVFIVCK
jgi:hypothetical protein|tara:strand:- start:11 stop:853 length:843 start_codon:yes stop_codon:yes gene_type:complete